MAARSPFTRKSIEHIYGTKNLPSDSIGKIVSNEFMQEAMTVSQAQNDEYARQKAKLAPKGIKER